MKIKEMASIIEPIKECYSLIVPHFNSAAGQTVKNAPYKEHAAYQSVLWTITPPD